MREKTLVEKYEECECGCEECVAACKRRTCWPLPSEAKALIEKGFANRLMLDYWVRYEDDIHIVCPAIVGYGGRRAPSWPTGRCTFLAKDNKCEIHGIVKPFEGKVVCCDRSLPDLHEEVAMAWDSKEGKEVVAFWKKEVGRYEQD